jgi:hypothetical protein
MNTPTNSEALPPTAGSASFTPGPWRYQKETTRKLGSSAPPRIRYEVYKEEGVYGHPASCDREEDARAISALPELIKALRKCWGWTHRAMELEVSGSMVCAQTDDAAEALAALTKALGPDWQNSVIEPPVAE